MTAAVTSLFSRLQKLNKEATPAEWTRSGCDVKSFDWQFCAGHASDAELIVECRNSLPAVLNLIEESQRIVASGRFGPSDFAKLEAVLAPFVEEVSGQEDERRSP